MLQMLQMPIYKNIIPSKWLVLEQITRVARDLDEIGQIYKSEA